MESRNELVLPIFPFTVRSASEHMAKEFPQMNKSEPTSRYYDEQAKAENRRDEEGLKALIALMLGQSVDTSKITKKACESL